VDGEIKVKAGSQLQFGGYYFFSSNAVAFYDSSCKIVSIDGTHCHRRLKGILLLAVGKDAELGNVVIGHALVPQENKYYWNRFMEALLRVCKNVEFLMSDKAKGIIYNNKGYCTLYLFVYAVALSSYIIYTAF
jgi:hypothetical protein